MKAKEPRISVRVSPELKGRVEAVVNSTGIDEATIVRNCLEAVCDEVEHNGALTFPLAITQPVKSPAAVPPAPVAKGPISYRIRPGAAELNEPRKRK